MSGPIWFELCLMCARNTEFPMLTPLYNKCFFRHRNFKTRWYACYFLCVCCCKLVAIFISSVFCAWHRWHVFSFSCDWSVKLTAACDWSWVVANTGERVSTTGWSNCFSFAKCVTKSDFAHSRAYLRFFFAVLLFHSGFLNTPCPLGPSYGMKWLVIWNTRVKLVDQQSAWLVSKVRLSTS